MTLGQRIAQKRKEQGLSQEALGDRLGVSRQSIYKWESDTALPEVENLVALSRLFGVSVGWLLGLEDPAPEQAAPPEHAGELTETQLKMVEEIVSRYLAAQPKTKPKKKWPWVLAGFAVFVGILGLINRLDKIDQQYQRVQMTVSQMQSSVNTHVNGIANRVEDILKSQNALTAEYGAALTATDFERNTVTFSAYAVPKTYVEGMEAVFVADSGDGPAEFPAALSAGRKFSGEVTTVLTDNITLSVVFIFPDGTRQTQLLDSWEYLYTESFPEATLESFDLWLEQVPDGILSIGSARYVTTRGEFPGKGGAKIAAVQVGLFKNRQLLGWSTPCDQPEGFHGFNEHSFYLLPDLDVPLAENDILSVAVLITDQYGRQTVCSEIDYVLDGVNDRLTYYNGPFSRDPAEWVFE